MHFILVIGHSSLIDFAIRFILCSNLVAFKSAWVAVSVLVSSCIPSMRAVQIPRFSSLGMPKPPSLLLQYRRPFGVLEGR